MKTNVSIEVDEVTADAVGNLISAVDHAESSFGWLATALNRLSTDIAFRNLSKREIVSRLETLRGVCRGDEDTMQKIANADARVALARILDMA